MPTATAIPLAATATPFLQAAGPSPRLTVTAIEPTPTAAALSTPTTTPVSLFQLDNLLAKSTAQRFLDRLIAADSGSSFDLYLTDTARAGEPGRLLTQLRQARGRLRDVNLVEFMGTEGNRYEGRAELHWKSSEGSPPAKQMLTLILAGERGRWLIDNITLGEPQAVSASTTPRPTTGGKLPTPRPEGKLVFQASSGGNIYVINAEGSGLRHLTDGLDPAWSPDGKQIAFSRWRHPWGISLIGQDGTGERRLVDGIQLKEVAWSPDGSQIAFTMNYGSSEPIEVCFFGRCFTVPPYSIGQLWVTDLDTGELLSLPLDDRAVHAPTWNPSDRRIVYAGDRGLAWIDPASMERGRFESSSAWDTSPAFSPDGQQIAFMGRVHDHWEILIMNSDGSGRRQLTHSGPQPEPSPSNVAPAWSPDGRYIAFLSNRDGPWRIYVMEANGSQQRPMFGSKLDDLGFHYEWASERVLSWGR